MTEMARRLGLVVATTEYDDARLARLGAPLPDALELARTLSDQGGFDVETLINAEAQTVQRRIERFCKRGRQHSDTILVYLTGHGVKDDEGNLYFALRDTDRDLLRTTALSADLLAAVMDDSPARSQLLMLDCCYSGAFARALRPKGQEDAELGERFGSSRRGRVVLAASSAIEPAWEGEAGSIYTRAVVDGIRTGNADLDRDGSITASELHAHVSETLRTEGRQSPRKFEFDEAGGLVVARAGADVPLALTKPASTTSTPSPPVPRESSKAPEVTTRAPVRIAGMFAVALGAILITLWLSGAIGFLPSPLVDPVTTTVDLAVPPAPTASLLATNTTDAASPTTAVGLTTNGPASTTSPEIPPQWLLVLEELFGANDRGWTEGDFTDEGGSYFFRFGGGIYETGFTSSIADQTYYSTVAYRPNAEPIFAETEATSFAAGSHCGLALRTSEGSLLATAIGDGEVLARFYTGGEIVNSGSWPVAINSPDETRLGMWLDATSVTIYVDETQLATFDEPGLTDVAEVGIALMGASTAHCGFDFLAVHEAAS